MVVWKTCDEPPYPTPPNANIAAIKAVPTTINNVHLNALPPSRNPCQIAVALISDIKGRSRQARMGTVSEKRLL